MRTLISCTMRERFLLYNLAFRPASLAAASQPVHCLRLLDLDLQIRCKRSGTAHRHNKNLSEDTLSGVQAFRFLAVLETIRELLRVAVTCLVSEMVVRILVLLVVGFSKST